MAHNAQSNRVVNTKECSRSIGGSKQMFDRPHVMLGIGRRLPFGRRITTDEGREWDGRQSGGVHGLLVTSLALVHAADVAVMGHTRDPPVADRDQMCDRVIASA